MTGSVVPVSSAALGFEQGGRLASVSVREGDHVAAGQLLAALDSSSLYAELKNARAALQIRRAESGNTVANLDAVEAAQDTLVENAWRTLLSEGLELVSRSVNETLDAPEISGRYEGPEGSYKLRVYRAPGGETAFRVFGTQDIGETKVRAADRPYPIGATGLFVSFPESHEDYRDTDWSLEIPNRSSAEYPGNLAAYEAAVRERDRVVQAARENLSQSSAETSIAAARVAQAEAEVARIEAEISSRVIRAPFAGLVKTVDAEVGEIASANAAVVTLISDGAFDVEAKLPEVDSARVRAGMVAKVTVDALGDENVFSGRVTQVDRAESLDGTVPVYKMTVYLDEPPAELRSGMTANIVVEVASAEEALAVPLSAVELAADGDFVTVARGQKKTERVPVSLGLRGDDGYVAVSGGIAEGDLVVLPLR